jgi:hypothetical protein
MMTTGKKRTYEIAKAWMCSSGYREKRKLDMWPVL